jgi:hypothetical protein
VCGPLVVVVDDLHWADVSSLRLLVFLARQLHDAAALIIGTYRDVEVAAGDHPARRLLAELAGQAELLQITGLTADEVGLLVGRVCGERPPTALVRAVHDRAHRVATLTESSRSGVIALLEEALAALNADTGADAGATRWLLPASLARELADGPDGDLSRAARLAHAAVDGARAAGDAGPLAYALFALGDVRWAPGTATERLGIAGELAAAAAAADETELVLEAHLSRLVALLELGDPFFAVQLATFTRLAEQAAIPRYLYLARSRQATIASLTGPLEAADELIESAAAYGERIGEPDAWGVQASQLVGLAFIRHDWTRLSHLAAARGLAPPEFAVHERAWLLIEAGDRDAAAALVASMPERPAAYRWRHTALLTSDAELAAAVADRRRCRALYEQLLPVAGEFAVVAAAVFTTGPVTLQLGLLAAALGRWDDAAAHLDDAARRCDRLGAALLAARARTELARVRAELAHAEAGVARAEAGVARAEAGVARAGMEVAHARPSRDHLAPGDGDRDGSNVFRRDGDVWTLAFRGRSVPLRDAKGLRDLAVLLAAPGREVAATDLVVGVTSAAGGPPGRRWRSPRWAPTRSSTTAPGPPTGPGWPSSTASWPRPTRITTSNGRPGWPPNATR